MTQITLSIESPSAAKAIRALVKNMVGVKIVPNSGSKRKSGYELAQEDVKAGRITEYSSVDELLAAAKK